VFWLAYGRSLDKGEPPAAVRNRTPSLLVSRSTWSSRAATDRLADLHHPIRWLPVRPRLPVWPRFQPVATASSARQRARALRRWRRPGRAGQACRLPAAAGVLWRCWLLPGAAAAQ